MIVFSFWLADYESSQNTVEVNRIMSLFQDKKYNEILDKTGIRSNLEKEEHAWIEKYVFAAEKSYQTMSPQRSSNLLYAYAIFLSFSLQK